MVSRYKSSNPTIGILGGGQLAKMLAQAALQLGCRVQVVEKNADAPAMQMATKSIVGDPNDFVSMQLLATECDVITLESEFINADLLARLETSGAKLLPGSETMQVIQDKLWQKEALRRAGLAVPEFVEVKSKESLHAIGAQFQYPYLLKRRRNGYDGKGNFTVRSLDDIEAAWTFLGGDQNTLMAEKFCPFLRELAIMIVRSPSGASVSYPVVETIQKDHICHVVKAPAPFLSAERMEEIAAMGRAAVQVFKGVGTYGVEMFETRDGQVLINEMAPRVHNSGHYTIEGAITSQFENHIRAVLDWPLGNASLLASGVVMINLLGATAGDGWPRGVEGVLREPGTHLHIYGKKKSAPGRKMGHLTVLANNLNNALECASRAAAQIHFGS